MENIVQQYEDNIYKYIKKHKIIPTKQQFAKEYKIKPLSVTHALYENGTSYLKIIENLKIKYKWIIGCEKQKKFVPQKDFDENYYIEKLYECIKTKKMVPNVYEFGTYVGELWETISNRAKKTGKPFNFHFLLSKCLKKHSDISTFERHINKGEMGNKTKEQICILFVKECNKIKKIINCRDFEKKYHFYLRNRFSSYDELITMGIKMEPRLKTYPHKRNIEQLKFSMLKELSELCKKNGRYITSNECRENKINPNLFNNIPEMFKLAKEKFPENFKNVKNKKDILFDKYYKKYPHVLNMYKKSSNGRLPEHIFKKIFPNWNGTDEELMKKSMEIYPDEFDNNDKSSVEENFTKTRYIELNEKLKRHKVFFITTYVSGQPLNQGFYDSIQQFCKNNNACPLYMVSNKKYEDIDANFINENIVFTPELYDPQQIINQEIKLNSNIHLSTIPISAKQICTVTGLDRLCVRDGTMIVAAPKQFLKYSSLQKNKPARAVMSTGAITNPVYDSDRFYQKRTDYIAHADHQIGGIIVEIEDDKYYHFRQVRADADGSFYDLHTKYMPTETKEVYPDAFVMGDLHSSGKDQSVFDTWLECIKTLKPKQVVLHDVCDSNSISHHHKDKLITQAIQANEGRHVLENEIKILVNDLNRVSELVQEVYIVKSNHDEHLNRYLEDGRYVQDKVNYAFAAKLVDVMMRGEDPLKYACELCGLKATNIKWLSRKDDHHIGETQLGWHGDLGANGGRSGLNTIEIAFPNSVIAHSHSPKIWRSVYVVGTTSKLDMGYNVGLSSWMHTSCIVHRNGARQLINCFDKKWRMNDKVITVKAKKKKSR